MVRNPLLYINELTKKLKERYSVVEPEPVGTVTFWLVEPEPEP